jgi:hypothetical protein
MKKTLCLNMMFLLISSATSFRFGTPAINDMEKSVADAADFFVVGF